MSSRTLKQIKNCPRLVSRPHRLLKRILDLVVGSLLVVLTLPVQFFIALAIKLDSPGPILFKQWRIGENGRPFLMLKFRTMVDGIDGVSAGTEVVHKRRDDPRVTRLGRLLRRWSLDELPQLWNVLLGEMSLVGPRPELPWIVEQYQPEHYRRLLVPPGLTGLWQIRSRNQQPMHLHVDDDLEYIENYSLWLDIWILLKTPLAVLSGRGAF